MCRYRFGVTFTLLAALTVWGCGQNGGGPAASKTARLQEEVQSLAKMRDQLRNDLKAAQADRERLQAEVALLKPVVRERDELKQALTNLTAERDLATSQLDQIKKGVRALVEQMEAGPDATRGDSTAALGRP